MQIHAPWVGLGLGLTRQGGAEQQPLHARLQLVHAAAQPPRALREQVGAAQLACERHAALRQRAGGGRRARRRALDRLRRAVVQQLQRRATLPSEGGVGLGLP